MNVRKILLLPLNYDHPQRGMDHAFTSLFGASWVKTFDYLPMRCAGTSDEMVNKAFFDTALEWKPDWIWMHLQDTGVIAASAIDGVKKALPKSVITHWTGDLRPQVSDYLSSICKVTDLTLISSTGQIPMFEKAGAKQVRYCQIGLDWEEDVLGTTVWAESFKVPDVIFIGNNYRAFPGSMERERAVGELMKAGIDVGVVGGGWAGGFPVIGTCTVKEQVHVWKKAKVGLSISNIFDVERYYSDRQLISMASGTPIITRTFPGIDEEFSEEETLRYEAAHQLPPLVKHLLADDALRARIGARGRQKVISEHTWFHRILDLLPLIEKIKATL